MMTKNTTKQIIKLGRSHFHFLKEEIILVSLHGEAKKIQFQCEGNKDSVTITANQILKPLIQSESKCFALLHSHIENSSQPSYTDFQSTKKIALLTQCLGIIFYDHLILSRTSYFSFREHYPKIFKNHKLSPRLPRLW